MFIIGISGGTGSGKTTVVDQITRQLPTTEICVISQDSYYKETSNLTYEERTKINFDNPKAIDFDLIIKHLKRLKEGHAIDQPVYSFIAHNRTKDFIKTYPTKVVIVEGILRMQIYLVTLSMSACSTIFYFWRVLTATFYPVGV